MWPKIGNLWSLLNSPGAAGGAKPSPNVQQGQEPQGVMGSIWDQLQGAGGALKKGIGALDRKLEENYAASGYAPEGYKSPYDKSVEEQKELDYTSTGEDIDVSKGPLTHKEKVDKVVASQKTPEGIEFKENMNRYKQLGDYAAGEGMGQAYGGPAAGMLGGWLNRLMGKMAPWQYEVESKHRYMEPKD